MVIDGGYNVAGAAWVVYHWLHAAGSSWGSSPILDAKGMQCTTLSSVDAAVQEYWVQTVLRRHASVDEEAAWAAFLASPVGAHIPVLSWPTVGWDAARVRRVLGCMREGAAPGSLGIPVAIWKSLPESWLAAVARLLGLVEVECC